MRAFTALIEKTASLRGQTIPNGRLDRARSSFDRIEEGIKEVFDEACLNNELEAAGDMLTLMDTWHSGRSYQDDDHKRIGPARLSRMRGELERRHIVRGFRRP